MKLLDFQDMAVNYNLVKWNTTANSAYCFIEGEKRYNYDSFVTSMDSEILEYSEHSYNIECLLLISSFWKNPTEKNWNDHTQSY